MVEDAADVEQRKKVNTVCVCQCLILTLPFYLLNDKTTKVLLNQIIQTYVLHPEFLS